MQLYLQYGHGMKDLSIELAKLWGGATVILSPRDMDDTQLVNWMKEFKKHNIVTLFDPQCYSPKGDPKKLTSYDYWNPHIHTVLDEADEYDTFINSIYEYNKIAETESFIIPSFMIDFNEHWQTIWVDSMSKLILAARKNITDRKIIATISLPQGFLVQTEDKIEELIEIMCSWDVDGFYVIAETVNHEYLVENEMWIVNVFNICAALKINKKIVIYGYGSHQMLQLSLAKVDAIASGTWLNVRSFSNRFEIKEDGFRRTTWIYYPHSLSEYKISDVDTAYTSNIWNSLPMSDDYKNIYYNALFKSVVTPGDIPKVETIAFKFYLCSLRHQINSFSNLSFEDTRKSNFDLLEISERSCRNLLNDRLNAKGKSILVFINGNKHAMDKLIKNRGVSLKMEWTNL